MAINGVYLIFYLSGFPISQIDESSDKLSLPLSLSPINLVLQLKKKVFELIDLVYQEKLGFCLSKNWVFDR